MSSPNYPRNDGGAIADNDAALIDAIINLNLIVAMQAGKIAVTPDGLGLGAPIYEAVFKLISKTAVVGYNTTTDMFIYGDVPRDGINKAVWRWIQGATMVNKGMGFYADFIREYTMKQFELRGGSASAAEYFNQVGSNQIALNLGTDIINNLGRLPGALGLGAIDAGAAASKVFINLPGGNADYAPWAGSLLFPFLGIDNFFIDLLLQSEPVNGIINGTDTTLKYTEGTYDLIAMLESARAAGDSASSDNFFDAFGNLISPGVIDNDQSNLVELTNRFFVKYYEGLPEELFTPGDDLLFNKWSTATGTVTGFTTVYQVGSYGNDTLIVEDATKIVVMNGGKGNDHLTGGNKGDLLDGDLGNDTLLGKDGEDYLYGGKGDDSLNGGKGNDLLYGGDGNDVYVFEGDFGTDVINDKDGIGSISIGDLSTSFTSVYNSEVIFRDSSKKYEAIKIDTGSSTSVLITSLSGNTGSVLVKNWKEGDLGISFTANTSTPGGGGGSTIMGDGNDNAITLNNLRDENPYLSISSLGPLYADGGAGDDIIMGMLSGNDTLLGGAGDDIISGGFTTGLGSNASGTFQSAAPIPGEDSIDGGAGNDFIFASIGGIAHGGTGDDVLVSTGPAFFQFNNLEQVTENSESGIPGHRAIKRDEILADMKSLINFGTTTSGSNTSLQMEYFKNFTSEYVEYPSGIEGVHYIAIRGNNSNNHDNGDVSYGFSGSYSITYDYKHDDGELVPIYTGNAPPLSIAVSWFAPAAGRTLDDYANVKGANLFGDAGNDYFAGGMYADYISGGADKDTVYAGAGNDIVEGGDGDDALHGQEGNDIIIGGDGNDIIFGNDGNDLLIGGLGSDGLSGGDGDDILVGHIGDQYLSGGDGDNIYIFEGIVFDETDLVSMAPPSHSDALAYTSVTTSSASTSSAPWLTIDGNGGNNTLALIGVNSINQISLRAQNRDLFLEVGNARFFIRDGLDGAIDKIALGNSINEFIDSTSAAGSVAIDDIFLEHLATKVTRTGQVAGAKVAGGKLNDTLTAHVDGSILIGGLGDDTLIGNAGNDIYVIRAGDGQDSITENGGTNIIKLSEGITADQLILRRNNGNLTLILPNTQTIVVNGMFGAAGEVVANRAIHRIEFSDGDYWDQARLLSESLKGVNLVGTVFDDLLIGYESHDTLTGGKGNDKLYGDKGDDRYNYSIGDGADLIDDSLGNDRIYFAEGIDESHVTLRRDTGNNLIIRVNNNDSITVLDAFNATGELTAKAIEHIHFGNTTVWDLQRIQSEIALDQTHIFTGTDSADVLTGDNAKQIFIGNKGDDQLNGGNANDVYRYALGDGKDVITDVNGNDRLELLTGINEGDVAARRNGDDLVLTMKDGGSITIQNTFGSKAANVVDPIILGLIDQLQTRWLSQAEKLLEDHYGLTGSGDLSLDFEADIGGAVAHVVTGFNSPTGPANSVRLVIDLSDFNQSPNGIEPNYHDRVIAHEMTHAVMARNMDTRLLPSWFLEGTAEFIHGADDRVKADAAIIGTESNFNQLFITTNASSGIAAAYSVSYIAVKLLDREIRNKGGLGIREVFDHLKIGKTLDQSLAAVSASLPGLAAIWNNVASFETHFKAVGFSQYTSLLTLDNQDTGSIAGSDYGHIPVTAGSVVPDNISGPSKSFQLVISDEYIPTPELRGELETITFNSGAQWDLARVRQEVLRPTLGNDTIHAFDGDETLSGSKGNDQLFGYAGNDVYRYSVGDGNDVIIDSAGTDQIEFGADILATEVRLKRDLTNNLVITLKDNSTITVNGAFNAAGDLTTNAVESIKFLSGGLWDAARIKQEASRTDATIIEGTDAHDTLIGSSAKDMLIGKRGNDLLQGKNGDDIYVYHLGDGDDQISDDAGVDEISLGEGILPNEITLVRQGWYGLKITLKDGGTILINNMFNSADDVGPNAIEGIRFSNSDFWDLSAIKNKIVRDQATAGNDIIEGFATNDVLEGGKGFDQLLGKGGDDRYLFNRGNGVDVITDTGGNDTLVFGSGIAPTDVVVHQSNGNVYFIINNGEMVQVTGSLVDGSPAEVTLLERVEFSNGVIWDKTIIQQKIVETLGNFNLVMGGNTWDYLHGGNTGVIINGLDGNDQIYGGGGDDTLIGGAGLNFLYGDEGNDTYLITEQPGIHFIEAFRNGFDRILFAEGITPEDVTVKLIPGRQESHLDNGVLWVYSFSQANDWNIELRVGGTVVYLDSLLTSGSLVGAKIENPSVPTGSVEFFNGTQWNINDLLQQAIKGTNADDNITGTAYGDVINGSQGNDFIASLGGADTLDGGEGDDTLIGGFSEDVLIGGKGNDYLRGDNWSSDYSNSYDEVDDVYRFNLGDGNDTIEEYFGRDTIEFGIGITKEQVILSTVGDDIVVSFLHSMDTITILKGALPETTFYSGGKIEIFKFANGDEWNFDPKSVPVLKEGTEGDDTLIGGYGNDTFIGHAGYDYLHGDLGDDSYHYNLGDGFDNIMDLGGYDQIVFGNAITPAMVKVRGAWSGGLIISINDVDSLAYNNDYTQSTPDSLLEKITFSSDGTVWNQAQIFAKALESTPDNDYIYGFSGNDFIAAGAGDDTIDAADGNDTLVGGIGNDVLYGKEGNDVYRFALGDGSDEIVEEGGNDTIEFLEGILPSDISVQRTETNLILKVKNANPITIVGFFDGGMTMVGSNRGPSELSAIENIKFANGDILPIAQLLATLSVTGTSGANTIYGLNAAELIDGKEGNDNLYGGGGNDTLIGGTGNDNLYGEIGDDLLRGGDGDDQLEDLSGNNIFEGGKGNDNIFVNYGNEGQGLGSATVRYGIGDGTDYIYGRAQYNRIELGAGITREMVFFKSQGEYSSGYAYQHSSGFDIYLKGTNDKLIGLIDNDQFEIAFSDNSVLKGAELSAYVNKSIALLSTDRQSITGKTEPGLKLLVSYRNQDNTITYYPELIADAQGNYSLNFGFGIKDHSRITVIGTDANAVKLPMTVMPPVQDISVPPPPTAELDASGYMITGFARPGTYVSVSIPDRHIGAITSDVITGAYTIFSYIRLNNGEKISVTASANALIVSPPTIISAPDIVAPEIPSGVFDNLGNSVSGGAEKGATVTITNLSGDILGTSSANAQTGAFTVNFTQPLANGELVKMIVHDAAGNFSSRYVRARDLTAPTTIYASVDKTGKIIKGFAEPGATVVVRNTQGGLLQQVLALAIDGAFEVTLGNALTANQVVNIKVIDTAGNSSAVIPLSAGASNTPVQPQVTLDTQGRLVTGVSTDAGIVIVRTKDNIEVGRTAVQAGASFSITLANAYLNQEILSVSLQNAGGVESAPNYFIAPDKIAPAKPSAEFDNYNFNIRGYAEPQSTVQILDEGNNIVASVIASATDGSFVIGRNFPILESTHLSVVSVDRAGNISSPLALPLDDHFSPVAPTGNFNATGKIVSGTAEPGTLVFIEQYYPGRSNNPVIGYTRASQDSSWSIELTESIIDGSIVNIISVDGANNLSSVSIVSPDLTAPLPAIAQFDSTGKYISGDAESTEAGGNQVIVMDSTNTVVLGSVVLGSYAGSYKITLATALKNNEVVNIVVKDVAGNVSTSTRINAPDKTAPLVPTANFDTTGQIITGTAEAGSTVIAKNSSGTELKTVVADATTGAYTLTLNTALINKETVNVTAKDAAGNISTAKSLIAPDLTAPTIPSASIDTTGKIITGTAEKGSTVIIKDAAGTELKTGMANASTGAYSITLTTAMINKESLSVTARDSAGNISPVRIIIAPDKTAPAAPTAIFDAAGKVITGVAEAGSTVSVKNAAGTELKTAVANATTGEYSITLTTALINKETVNVTAKDTAGNVSAIKAIIAPDNTAPTIPTAAFDTAGKVITGVAEAGSTVSVKNAAGTELKTAVANTSTGAYTITLTTALINKETVNVTAKDSAGNISAIKAIIAPDKTPPAAPTVTINSARKIISGVAEAGSTVEVKNTSGTLLGSIAAHATTGAYSITLANALSANQTVNVTAKDAAGNVSSVKSLVAAFKAQRELISFSDETLVDSAVLLTRQDNLQPQVGALVQAIAAFEPVSGVDVKRQAGYYEVAPLVLAVNY